MMNREELKLEMLDKVTGGSIEQETAEMKGAILGNPHLRGLWDQCMADPMNEGDDWWCCTDVLYQIWDISTGMGDDVTIYDYGDYSHAQIIEMLNNYKP